MKTGLAAASIARLEKAALDNGFDRELGGHGDWLSYGSSFSPLKVWLTSLLGADILVAVSRRNVADALEPRLGAEWLGLLPGGAVAARAVPDFATVERLLRRCYQLSRTLPDELLHEFEKKTSGLPRTTEVERLVVQRVGQEIFRDGLLEYWDGRCAVTGLAIPALLRASHIKRWADCEADAERLDVFNGILLAPHLDALFDAGFVTFGSDGEIIVSGTLDVPSRRTMGLENPLRASRSLLGHERYLAWHRQKLFKAEA